MSYSADCIITPAILGGVLGLSIINVILFIVVVVLVTRKRNTFAPSVPPSSVNAEGDGGKRTTDIEMKPNSLYGLITSGESIVTNPSEVYGVSEPAAYGNVDL